MKLTQGMYIRQDRGRYANKTGYLYEVKNGKRVLIKTLTPMQVLAYRRHYPSELIAYQDGNGRWKDASLVGDFDAFMTSEPL